MMTEEFKNDLRIRYGDHVFDYPNLSDHNVKSVIRNHDCRIYEDLDRYCRELNGIVGEIRTMQEAMR